MVEVLLDGSADIEVGFDYFVIFSPDWSNLKPQELLLYFCTLRLLMLRAADHFIMPQGIDGNGDDLDDFHGVDEDDHGIYA